MNGRLVRVLNVAEKPSVAKEVSRCLSNGSARFQQSCAPYCGNYTFSYTINNMPCEMVFTSVAGHLQELEFTSQYRKWHSCTPVDLYNAPVEKSVPQDKLGIKRNLEQQARQCQWLVLWLDCDREGENIAFEVIDVCCRANRGLVVKRARFSALIPRDLHRACQSLVAPNENDAKAVDARQEIDLRIGASFTRFQTLLLQDKFDWAGGGVAEERPVISFGPCQFPTLGLIVQRAWEIQAHIPEEFWCIHVGYRSQDSKACEFQWDRRRLFDHASAVLLYEMCVEAPLATVSQVAGSERRRHPPHPLSTLELQKKATGVLRLPGERIMKLAEELYQAGFLSYPRTETDIFDPGFDLQAIVGEHTGDARWGQHAQRIVSGEMWKPPGGGGHDDKAHPPIHPTKYSPGEHDWSADKKKLYEFVVRSFLATCSKPAIGFETKIAISIASEGFHTTGLMVVERNWLEVYPYTSWGGNANLPLLQQGQQFMPTELLLKQGTTQPAPRLSERDLISLMERHGIGTDATVAEHIQKQLARGYATKDAGSMTFWPTSLGEALVGAYRAMGLENLWLPDLRAKIEANIMAVAAGRRSKEAVLAEAVQAFRGDFVAAQQQQRVLEREVARFFSRHQPAAGGPGGGGVQGDPIGPCRECEGGTLVLQGQGGQWRAVCSSAPLCRCRTFLPALITAAAVSDQRCPACLHGAVMKVDLRLRLDRIPMGFDPIPNRTACMICDRSLRDLFDACPRAAPPPPPPGGGGASGVRHAGRQQGDASWQQNGAGRGPNNASRGGHASSRGRGGAAGSGGRGGAAGGRGRGRGSSAGAASQAPPSAPPQRRRRREEEDDDFEDRRPPQRGRGAVRQPDRASGRGAPAARGGRGRAGARGGGSGGQLPSCPMHGLEVLCLTSRSPANPDRRFYKCAHPSEAEQCLRFVWADEWQGPPPAAAPRGRGRRGASSSSRGAPGARGGRGGRPGRAEQGNFVLATGHVMNSGGGDACFKCGGTGHWSRDCPNQGE